MLSVDEFRFALDTYPQLKLVPQEPHVGGPGLTWNMDNQKQEKVTEKFDVDELTDCAKGVQKGLSEEESKLVQRFDPSTSDTIGFFIAKFIKMENK
jgi:hypothetical protein